MTCSSSSQTFVLTLSYICFKIHYKPRHILLLFFCIKQCYSLWNLIYWKDSIFIHIVAISDAFHFFVWIPISISFTFLPTDWGVSFVPSCTEVLMVINSVSFCIYEKVLFCLPLWHIFSGYSSKLTDFCLFVVSILKALLHSLAGCVSSIETFTRITLVLLCTERSFSRLLLWLSLHHWF